MKKLVILIGFMATFCHLVSASENPLFISKLSNPSVYSAPVTLNQPESICGNNDLQQIEAYNGSDAGLGFDVNFVSNAGRSVGAIKTSASASLTGYCSGTLVGNNLFLTASHCVGNGTVGDFVAFDYQRIGGTGSYRPQQFFQITGVVEDGVSAGLDYAVLSLSGNPGTALNWQGSAFGWKSVTHIAANNLLIVQHPNGEAKQMDAGSNPQYTYNRVSYSNIDTRPGSSGSGIVDNLGRLVGVHTHGGCTASSGSNSGVNMQAILDVSNVLTPGLPPVASLTIDYNNVPLYASEQTVYFRNYNLDNGPHEYLGWSMLSGASTRIEYKVDFGTAVNEPDVNWTLYQHYGVNVTTGSLDFAVGPISTSNVPYHNCGSTSRFYRVDREVKLYLRARHEAGGQVSDWRYSRAICIHYMP